MSSRVNNAEQAEAVKGRALEEVERDLAWCTDELEELRGERDSLPAQVEEATAALDSGRLAELERRGRELSRRIDEAQARFCQLQAERARLLLPGAEARAVAAKAEYERAHAAYLEAYTRTNRLGVESNNAAADAYRLRLSIDENERRARELTCGLAAQ